MPMITKTKQPARLVRRALADAPEMAVAPGPLPVTQTLRDLQQAVAQKLTTRETQRCSARQAFGALFSGRAVCTKES
jgi:hypothetical protein